MGRFIRFIFSSGICRGGVGVDVGVRLVIRLASDFEVFDRVIDGLFGYIFICGIFFLSFKFYV